MQENNYYSWSTVIAVVKNMKNSWLWVLFYINGIAVAAAQHWMERGKFHVLPTYFVA